MGCAFWNLNYLCRHDKSPRVEVISFVAPSSGGFQYQIVTIHQNLHLFSSENEERHVNVTFENGHQFVPGAVYIIVDLSHGTTGDTLCRGDAKTATAKSSHFGIDVKRIRCNSNGIIKSWFRVI
ncbi:hypothetical protein TNCV_3921341 [Trichonephila clavipes]|nr:hypothetical protein TNCV_3921341 [Trichonephila clavipes]